MKRKLMSVILVLILCLSLGIAVFASGGNIYDDADLLSDREEAKLSARLDEISRAYGAQIAIVTTNSTDDGNADAYAESFFDSTGLGYGADRDGILLMICMDIRQYRILSNGYAASAVSSAEIDKISDAMLSDLSNGNYYTACTRFANQCDYYLGGYNNGFPFEFGTYLLLALALGLVTGLIVVLILRAQLKSVHRKNQANVYVKHGSMKLTAHHDIFLYRNVTRRKKESSSSGSRSSRNIGGGSF